MSTKSLSAYVIIYPVPIVPLTVGKSTWPLIAIVVPAGTLAKPVITHLLIFWTIHPIYPEAPDLANNPGTN